MQVLDHTARGPVLGVEDGGASTPRLPTRGGDPLSDAEPVGAGRLLVLVLGDRRLETAEVLPGDPGGCRCPGVGQGEAPGTGGGSPARQVASPEGENVSRQRTFVTIDIQK